MTCNQSQLNALADGELDIWAAARLRRHLRTCPACAEEYEAIQNLGIQMQAWHDVTAPAGLEARIASVLPQARAATARRRLAWRPLAAMAVAAMVFAAIALFMPGQPGQPAIAFADVEQAMQDIKTAHWVSVWVPYDRGGRAGRSRQTEFWARLHPPAVVRFALPDTTARGQTRRPVVWFISSSPDPAPFLLHIISESTLAPDARPGPGISRIPWRGERTALGGRPMIRFHRETTGRLSSGTDMESVWADPVTHRVIRSEHRYINRYTGRTTSVNTLENFQYDVRAPSGTFDVKPKPLAPSPPAPRVAWTRIASETPPRKLWEMQTVINASEAAWRRGDFTAFAAVWDFRGDGPNHARSVGAQWKQRVQRQRGHWRRWESRIIPGSAEALARVSLDRHGAGRLPTHARPEQFIVMAATSGAWAEDGDTWQNKASRYYFRETGGKFRITNWADPTSEIREEHNDKKHSATSRSRHEGA